MKLDFDLFKKCGNAKFEERSDETHNKSDKQETRLVIKMFFSNSWILQLLTDSWLMLSDLNLGRIFMWSRRNQTRVWPIYGTSIFGSKGSNTFLIIFGTIFKIDFSSKSNLKRHENSNFSVLKICKIVLGMYLNFPAKNNISFFLWK